MKQLAQYIAAPSRLGKIWRKFDCCLLLSDCAVLCCAILCAMACLPTTLLACYISRSHKLCKSPMRNRIRGTLDDLNFS